MIKLKDILTEEVYKVAGREVTLNKNGGEDQTKWTVTFKQSNKTVPYADVISLIKPRPKLQEPRWQDNDGDGKWYEKGDDVSEQTQTQNPNDFDMGPVGDKSGRIFPYGTSFFELTDRTDKNKKLQIAFIDPRNGKGPFSWVPFKSSAHPDAMQTMVKIECREPGGEWESGKLGWVSHAPNYVIIKLDNGDKFNNFENDSIKRMFTQQYEKYASSQNSDTINADI
jgi:hypothetical protein